VPRPAVAEAVARARESAVRPLPRRWAESAGRRVTPTADLVRALDTALAGIDFGLGRRPGRWWLAAGAQWVLLVLALAGVLTMAVSGGSALVDGPVPELIGGPLLLPAAVTVGSLLVGLVLAGSMAPGVRAEAVRCREAAVEAMRTAVEEVAHAHVLGPLAEERARLDRVGAAVDRARGA
ncbi:MAG: hypothetical protein ACRDYU_06745, partial [Actinomycetes bacterium]